MPFAKRCVEPVKISRQPLDPSLKFDLDAVSNNALVGALRQLASLAHHAEDLFADLGEEFKFVVNRAERLKNRLDAVTETVGQLDAKTVTVPVGDLATFTRTGEHFSAHHGFEQNLFTPASRPDYLDKLYDIAMPSPVKHIRQCNEFRTDGRTGSKLFSLVPVFSKENLDPPPLEQDGFKKPTELIILEREAKTVPKYRRRPHSIGAATDLEFFKRTPPLPTPEDRMKELSQSQPSAFVPIDVTGTSFDRMCEYRQSLRSASTEFVDNGTKTKKRKRRSQTISGIPGYVQDELNKEEYHEFSVLTRSRSPGKEQAKSTSGSQFIDTLRGRERDKKKVRSCSNGFLSCLSSEDTPVLMKRSKSLPRSMSKCRPGSNNRLGARSSSADVWLEDAAAKPLLRQKKKSKNILPRAHSVHGMKDISNIGKESSQLATLARDFKRASTDLSTASSTSSRSRPQSMEIRTPASDQSRYSIPISTPKTPSVDSVSSSVADSSRSLSQNPKTINGVKMRQSICKATKEDRQSSSGNWSGSSSARQSLESDYQRSLTSAEVNSNSHDKDSALSLNIQANGDKELSSDKPVSDSNGYGTESSTLVPDDISTSTMTSTNSYFTNMPSHLWLRSLEKERSLRLGMMDQMSSSSQDTISSVPKLTVHNLKAHECALLPYLTQTVQNEDDNTSLYSVDQEGFYTSFHMDSGVQKQNFQLLDDDMLLSDNNMDKVSMGVPVFKERAVKMRRRSSNASLLLCQLPKMMRGKKPKSKKILPPPPVEEIDIKAMVSNALAGHVINTDTPMQRFEKEPRRIGSKDDLFSSDAESRSSTLKSNASSGSRQPVYNSWYKFHEDDLESQSTISTKSSNRSSMILHGPAHDAVNVSESDAETVYARLKQKTTISSNVYPSICSVTLDDSDDEDNIRGASKVRSSMSFSASSLRSSISNKSDETVKSQYLPPWFPKAEENKYATLPAKFSQSQTHKALVNEDVSSTLPRQHKPSLPKVEKTDGAVNESDYATWPRSPMGHKMEVKTVGILKSSTDRKTGPPKPPRTLNFAPTVNMFDPEAQHIQSVLPEPLTPDDILEDRGLSCEYSSFKATTLDSLNISSVTVPQNSVFTNQEALPELCSQQSGSSINASSSASGSMSSSASTSTESDDRAPELPPRYQHSIRVRPGDKNKATKKRRPVSLPPGVKRQHSVDENSLKDSDAKQLKRDHIYANVVLRKPKSMPTTPVGACLEPVGEISSSAVSVGKTSSSTVSGVITSTSSSSLTPTEKSGVHGHSDSVTSSVTYRRRNSANSEGDTDKTAKRNSHYASTDIFDFNKTPSVSTAESVPPKTASGVKHYAAAAVTASSTWPRRPSLLSSPEPVYTTAQQKPGLEFVTITLPKTSNSVVQSTTATPMRTFSAKIDSTGVLVKKASDGAQDLCNNSSGNVATIYKATGRRNSVTSGNIMSPSQPITVTVSTPITESITPVNDMKMNTNRTAVSTIQPNSTSASFVFSKPVTLFSKSSTADSPLTLTSCVSTVNSVSFTSSSITTATKTSTPSGSSWYKPSIGLSPPLAFSPVTNVSAPTNNVFSVKNPLSSSCNNSFPSITCSISSSDTAGHKKVYTSPTVATQNGKTATTSSTKNVTSPCNDGEIKPAFSIGHSKILISPKKATSPDRVTTDPSSSAVTTGKPDVSRKLVSPSATGSKVTTLPIIKAAHPVHTNSKATVDLLIQDQSATLCTSSSVVENSPCTSAGSAYKPDSRFSPPNLTFSLVPPKTDQKTTINSCVSPVSNTPTQRDSEKSTTQRPSVPLNKPPVSKKPSPAVSLNWSKGGSTVLSSPGGAETGLSPPHPAASSSVTLTIDTQSKPRAASEEPTNRPTNLVSSSGMSRSMRDLFFQESNGQNEQSKPPGGSSWDRINAKSSSPPTRKTTKVVTNHDIAKTNSFSFLKTPVGLFTASSSPGKNDSGISQVTNSASVPLSSSVAANGQHVTYGVNGVNRVASFPPPPPSAMMNPKHAFNKSSTEPKLQNSGTNGTASSVSQQSQLTSNHSNSGASGVVDEAAVMSILDSIKSSLKVISDNNNSQSSVVVSKQTAV